MPIRRRISSGSSRTSRPSTQAWPSDGAMSAASRRTVVVLPAPFGPEQAEHLARCDLQAHVADRPEVAEPPAEAVEAEHGRRRRSVKSRGKSATRAGSCDLAQCCDTNRGMTASPARHPATPTPGAPPPLRLGRGRRDVPGAARVGRRPGRAGRAAHAAPGDLRLEPREHLARRRGEHPDLRPRRAGRRARSSTGSGRDGWRSAACSSSRPASRRSIYLREEWQFFVLWGVVVGVGTGAVSSVLGATVATRWFRTHRGMVVGLFAAASSAGQLVFLPTFVTVIEATRLPGRARRRCPHHARPGRARAPLHARSAGRHGPPAVRRRRLGGARPGGAGRGRRRA